MTDAPLTNEPSPELDEVLAEEPAALPVPCVPVRVDGPVTVQELPAMRAAPFSTALATTFQKILGRDPKRRRVVLLGDANWIYSSTGQGGGITWPSNVALVLENGDAVYAKLPTGTGNLQTVPEYWAD